MSIESSDLLKLRLVVARFGESDGMGWWSTNGMLGRAGTSVLRRGFPITHRFAQARAVCTVATARCQSVFAPPGCITLWNLPVENEDALDASWLGWCRDPAPWADFFERLEMVKTTDLVEMLLQFGLIDTETIEAVKGLRRSAEGKAVPLQGTGKPDLTTVRLLAAGFSKGEKQRPAVPYIRLSDA